MRGVVAGTLSLALLSTCGAPARDSSTLDALRSRAAIDLACPERELTIEERPDGRRRVTGCHRERTYVLWCDAGPDGTCVWSAEAPPPASPWQGDPVRP